MTAPLDPVGPHHPSGIKLIVMHGAMWPSRNLHIFGKDLTETEARVRVELSGWSPGAKDRVLWAICKSRLNPTKLIPSFLTPLPRLTSKKCQPIAAEINIRRQIATYLVPIPIGASSIKGRHPRNEKIQFRLYFPLLVCQGVSLGFILIFFIYLFPC